jgi:hypothetical protein
MIGSSVFSKTKKNMFVLVQTKLVKKGVDFQKAIATVDPSLLFCSNRATEIAKAYFKKRKTAEAATEVGKAKKALIAATEDTAKAMKKATAARQAEREATEHAEKEATWQEKGVQNETTNIEPAKASANSNGEQEHPSNFNIPINGAYERKNKELNELLKLHGALVVRVLVSGAGGEVKETHVGSGTAVRYS